MSTIKQTSTFVCLVLGLGDYYVGRHTPVVPSLPVKVPRVKLGMDIRECGWDEFYLRCWLRWSVLRQR